MTGYFVDANKNNEADYRVLSLINEANVEKKRLLFVTDTFDDSKSVDLSPFHLTTQEQLLYSLLNRLSQPTRNVKTRLISPDLSIPYQGKNIFYLKADRWNDYSFVTAFNLHYYDKVGKLHDLGWMKIGFKGQTTEQKTYEHIHALFGDKPFEKLPETFLSLGATVDYYQKIAKLDTVLKEALLKSLRDIVYQKSLLEIAKEEEVFGTSLLRNISLSIVSGQFSRVLNGQALLTDYNFTFSRHESKELSAVELGFRVQVDTKPSTNVHAIIGRNGVGKTKLLNAMIGAIVSKDQTCGVFYEKQSYSEKKPIKNDYFSALVSVSFSAFDPFVPPKEQPNPALGNCYHYIGLKKPEGGLKTSRDIHQDFLDAIQECMWVIDKGKRWKKAISTLESDEIFKESNLSDLLGGKDVVLEPDAISSIAKMGAGHLLVLLTITKLVATVDEKTLVIIDEPETHLHPPLLSAFVRALSELLLDRNGVAILATHSPVVLQEIPSSCVWKLNRTGSAVNIERPRIETFGENVGILTREVFGLEVVRSGFYNLLLQDVNEGEKNYSQLLHEYGNQLGFEARALLKALLSNKETN